MLQLPGRDVLLLLEAGLLVLAYGVAFRWLSPRRLLRGLEGEVERRQPAPEVERVAWAAGVADRELPGSSCLRRSAALSRMLRRRGVAARPRLGVARRDGELRAHAWVEVGAAPPASADGAAGMAASSLLDDDDRIVSTRSLTAALSAQRRDASGFHRGLLEPAPSRLRTPAPSVPRARLVAALHPARPAFDFADLDGAALADAAIAEGVAALLRDAGGARGCKGSGDGAAGLPPEVEERLAAACLQIAARDLEIQGRARGLLRAAAAAGIELAVLRGPALAALLAEPAPRPMGDLDLLVRDADVTGLRRLMTDAGFREMDRSAGFAERYRNTLKFVLDGPFPVVVEPHLSIAYPPFIGRLDMQAVWRRCQTAEVCGERCRVLGLTDLLVHLCLHLQHRDDAPLLWVWELDRSVRLCIHEIDWPLLLGEARAAGVGRLVHAALGRAMRAFDTPVPATVLERLRRGAAPASLAERLAHHPAVAEREGLAVLLALDGPRRKLRYARELLFPGADFMMSQYGLERRRQLPLAYLRRFVRFAWEGTTGIARLVVESRRRSAAQGDPAHRECVGRSPNHAPDQGTVRRIAE